VSAEVQTQIKLKCLQTQYLEKSSKYHLLVELNGRLSRTSYYCFWSVRHSKFHSSF